MTRTTSAPTTSDTRTDRSGGRRLLRILVAGAALVAGLLLGACESLPADVAAVRAAVNDSRAAHGLAPLAPNVQLDIKADLWAQQLRNSCALSHSDLGAGMPAVHRGAAENVGLGPSVEVVHSAYMASPGHRRNVLDPRFDQMGAAAVWGECGGRPTVFTVHVFLAS